MVTATHSIRVVGVRAELRSDSANIAEPRPRLSWRTEASLPDWWQESAEVELDEAISVVLPGDASVLLDWPFEPLAAREHHTLRVRVTGTDGSVSDWSEPTHLFAAFLGDEEWTAAFVGLAHPEREAQPALMRTEFDARAGIRQATLYSTSLGAHQVELNGHVVDDELLKPGWTSYQFRLVHETTDVTALLRSGPNAMGISLAGAWYTEKYGPTNDAHLFYGGQPAVAAQLVIEYDDGSLETIATDAGWLATGNGPITASGLYAGESVDARLLPHGWSEASFDATGWAPVALREGRTPEARRAPAVRAIEERVPVDVLRSPYGHVIVDFGQNLVGRLRLRVNGPRGHTITVRHAEVLENGGLGTRPLRSAAATDTFTLAGDGAETFEPAFTFHGFRYAELADWPGDFDPSNVTAVVIHSDMTRTGWFTSSVPNVDRLHENVVWSMKGNFLALPTDCPQRDERFGWTGDIQMFAPTASFLFDSEAFLSSWLEDLRLEQVDGVVPLIVPNVLRGGTIPAAAWGDAATIVPSVLYDRFGDLGIVRRQFDSMQQWVDAVAARVDDADLWSADFQFGDWLDPDAPPDSPAEAKTDRVLVATAYLAHSADLVARAAHLLGFTEDATHYAQLHHRIRFAFTRAFVHGDGTMTSDAQTAYALAIVFDLVDATQRAAMGDRLAELVRAADHRIGTGFVGTPIVADALTSTGHLADAAALLLQERLPSWLYPVTMGATTIWERWDSMLEDGSINPGEMTSFNHYALGAVADWLHRVVAGLAPAAPGYRVVRIAPQPLPGFDHAEAVHDTPYGRVVCGWRREAGSVNVHATVPANARAEVLLPGSDEVFLVGSGSHTWTVAAQVFASA